MQTHDFAPAMAADSDVYELPRIFMLKNLSTQK